MKKIISILVAMVMVLSAVSVFAAVEVNTNPSFDYFNTFSGVADYTATSNAGSNPSVRGNVGLNKDHPVDAVMSGEQFTIKRPEFLYKKNEEDPDVENKKTGLAYLYFTPSGTISDDKFAIGFDFKFSGIESNTANSVYTMNFGTDNLGHVDSTINKVNSGEWFIHTDGKAYAYTKNEDGSIVYDDNGNPVPNGSAKASKTGWRFYADGSARPGFQTKKSGEEFVLGNNGKPAIFCGNAQLEQDAFYTFKMYIDQNTKSFKVVIIDADGDVLDTGINGKIQNNCGDVHKVDGQLQAGLNYDASVTFDNIFCDPLEFAIKLPATLEPSEDNEFSFSASIPDYLENTKLYINDTFVENITLVKGKTDYDITTKLPEGTVFGDVEVEIRGTLGGEEVSATSTVRYAKILVNSVEIAYDASKISGYDENEVPYYGPGDTRTKEFSALVDGLYEIGAKVKFGTASQMVVRLKSEVINNGSTAVGALLDRTTGDAWNHVNISKWGIPAGDETWHDVTFFFDFRGDATKSAQPYSIMLDGRTVKTGTFVMDSRTAINGFVELGMYGVNYKEVYIKERIEVGAKSVVATYANGTTAEYEDEALVSVALDKLTIALTAPFDSADNMSFVDETGNDVDGVALALVGSDVVITPDDNVTIPTGSYKLVIDKTATISGDALGADIVVPVELTAPNTVIAPADGAEITDEKINLVFYSKDAEKVVVYVNDKLAKTFEEASESGIYEFTYVPKEVGKNYIDVYTYTASGVELVATDFVWKPYSKSNIMGAGFRSDSWSPISGAQGVNVDAGAKNQTGGFALNYTVKVTSGNRFINLVFSSETSGTQRIGVREYDIMLGENTKVYTELGVSKSGEPSVADANYPNFSDWPGTAGKYLFATNGTIAGSSYTWKAGQWYHVKHILDLENKIVQVYITNSEIGENVLVASMDISGNSTVKSCADTIANYSKYRIHILPIDAESEVMPSITISNPLTYQLKALPVATAADETIVAGTDEVTVTLDTPYDALEGSDIFVMANGEDVDSAVAEVSEDGKTITVSGLAGVKAGTRLEIAVSATSLLNSIPVGKDSVATIFVTDKDNVCVFPVKAEGEDGADLLVYAKYINGSGNLLDAYFITTEYEENAPKGIKKTKFATVSMEPGETGVVSSLFENVEKVANCKTMLWSKALEQLAQAK